MKIIAFVVRNFIPVRIIPVRDLIGKTPPKIAMALSPATKSHRMNQRRDCVR